MTHPASDPTGAPPETSVADDPLPRAFGKYQLLRRFGAGGMAAVYHARDGDRDCAIKIPRPGLRTDRDREQFEEEVRALRNLQHPNLCGLSAAGEIDTVPYLDMPLIAGAALSDYTRENGPLEVANALELVHTLALAVQHAHDRGVIHRDLKPANVIVTPDAEPVVVDFGLALSLTDPDARPDGRLGGSRNHIPPEVVRAVLDRTTPPPPRAAWDVYALGLILYELLTGRLPWPSRTALHEHLAARIADPPIDPRAHRPELSPDLARVCLRALAPDPAERYESMHTFAHGLACALADIPTADARPDRIGPERFQYAFVKHGALAPEPCPPGQLYLDVGNRLAPGAIDHHRLLAYSGSTTRLVSTYPGLLDATLARLPAGTPLTVSLHEWPDLDAVAAAYLAREYLTAGRVPEKTNELVRYIDWVDRGALGVTRDNPYSLYAAFQVLASRPHPDGPTARWTALVENGSALLRHVLRDSAANRRALTAVDAFVPALFAPEEREAAAGDLERYERRLADSVTGARRVRLRLPNLFGGTTEVEMLLVRDVQNEGDPDRCLYFKDWARLDRNRCPATKGFIGLCVFQSDDANRGRKRRCIISLRPGADHSATLRGLGGRLDRAEAQKRRRDNEQRYGSPVDDRQVDPRTGAPRDPRPGYDNADPWYDGRSHGFTIVDSPAQGLGTVLTEDEIVDEVLSFGGALAADVRSVAPGPPTGS
jgi:serine/threonine protein kinase